MRRVLMGTISALILAVLTIVAVTVSGTPVSNAPAIVLPTPTNTLPACITEDGAGMARCYWDAQAQGNGMGTSMVSGDCALAPEASDLTAMCIALYGQPGYEVANEDGSYNSVPNGADLVRECNDESRNEIGIELQECYANWLK